MNLALQSVFLHASKCSLTCRKVSRYGGQRLYFLSEGRRAAEQMLSRIFESDSTVEIIAEYDKELRNMN
jgi:hypothetical protein